MDPDVSTPTAALPASTPAAMPRRQSPMAPPATVYSAFIPVMVLAVAVVGWLGLQAYQQLGERQQIQALQAGLDQQEITAKKLRASLDTVATATAKLAADGNATARVIVEELRKRGITINANGAPKPP